MPSPKQDTADRDRQIVAKARLGITHEAIAKEHNLTRARVGQIIKAHTAAPPGEAERQEIAQTMRAKFNELQAIIDSPPLKVSAMARPTPDPRTGGYVTDQSVVVRCIAEQNRIAREYREMFSLDISRPPAPLIDARTQILINQAADAQRNLDAQAPRPALTPLPADYWDLPPEQQAAIQMERHSARVHTQTKAIQGELQD